MEASDTMRPVVLVHGAWHGGWCWERVTPLLDAAGVVWRVAELPSCTRSAAQAGVLDDVREVERILDELPGSLPAVVLGHSRGGLVISECGTHERVGHLVYLCALLLEPGADPVAMLGETVMPALAIDERLVSTVDPTMAAGLFYNDCAAADTEWAVAHVSPMSVAGAAVDPPRAAWRHRPTTYVVCEDDAAISADHQRAMASNVDQVVTWPTGHSPFISRPDLVAELLIGLARQV